MAEHTAAPPTLEELRAAARSRETSLEPDKPASAKAAQLSPKLASRLARGPVLVTADLVAHDNRSARPYLSRATMLLIVLALLFASLLGHSHRLAMNEVARVNAGCEMAYMSPSYIKLAAFGTEYSRLAGKYSTYLYREVGWDLEPHPAGIPVLFAPGNAGSFRQIRSLAAAAARQFYDSPGVPNSALLKAGARHLDFFAVDFNEDFSAFHGTTLLEEAEYLNDAVRYILSLYTQEPSLRPDLQPDPTAVVMIGHSMGGIAARKMLLMPNYQPGSVLTIVTLSTPHVVPPAAFDAVTESVYSTINTYWQQAFSRADQSRNSLRDVALISLSGGTSDTTIASDSVSVAALTPPTHGMTIFTTSLPDLFSPVDHQAMMWCNQIRNRLAWALLRMTNVHSASQTVALPERMRIFHEELLIGLEDEEVGLTPLPFSGTFRLDLSTQQHAFLSLGSRLVRTWLASSASESAIDLMPIPQAPSYDDQLYFVFLTDLAYAKDQSTISLCRAGADSQDHVVCSELPLSYVKRLPSTLPEHDSKYASLSFVELPLSDLREYAHIAIRSASRTISSFVLAEFIDRDATRLVRHTTMSSLLFGGLHVANVVEQASLLTHLHLPAMDSSLLQYQLEYFDPCKESSIFSPLLRVFSNVNFESVWLPNAGKSIVYLHGTAPYVRGPTSPYTRRGLSLMLWRDPTCEAPAAVFIRLDLLGSLAKLIVRYRMVLAAWPLAITLLTFRRQTTGYDGGECFRTFSSAFNQVVARDFIWLLLGATSFAFVQCLAVVPVSLPNLRPPANYRDPAPHLGDMLVGNHDLLFVPLSALILVLSGAVAMISHLLLQSIVSIATTVYTWLEHAAPSRLQPYLRIQERNENPTIQRIVSLAALLLLVLLFAPYQFAYLVLTLVHLFSTVRAYILLQDPSSATALVWRRRWDRYHYYMVVLLIMLWLLPMNAAILIVWVRNLSAGWIAPFSSDHNVLSVAGFLLWVEGVHTGRMLPRSQKLWRRNITSFAALAIAIIAILYGIRYTYLIPAAVNIYFFWLAFLHAKGFNTG
ncbi:uncharacterized protein L969DRAFT_14453 [Mixia osmundae IAM 14324]|uniref:GPI inositol-deacylase n=1 Tax=Mixia osmundae (strain CBS 9802 / IAM 14324 / JCM 22182 / KY 12970) TaxID=764103 RepID=G7E097_MIXOS|nr:uncharacterized protein L969DRAFT_14453 [Mixia osmundae IAM 14324]KEI42247.1 hypothetical protein L969DRAFT_14453 [Mixia osmundae IAM 14324]GAA96257.1 hypothetical protein E5Q_02921 [Mixia osmundae IAM 14324]